ncbi:peptidylprolyl isomerase [Isoptericola sp. CG 20/1183]|uniref:peptidylprolyl isomerase n=1 Tax=Isoptericola halotolerans TaxID=300560 RepID=A0ABX5EFI8_9MICO|nr:MULTISPECIES: FKBP-type peptidyl-prolyl cis-trans isomerase [Isoptericola]PRZ04835.1 peptidylprolyl isomerase [Isoptericola halotolerans]PRZ05326.1 peptidylprolyl isomerase [Isoptericola sp. CG 20/1183]
MKLRTAVGATSVVLAASLALAGCADDSAPEENSPSPEASAETSESAEATDQAEPTEADIAAVEAIKVTGDPGSEPELAFEGLEVSVPTTRVVDTGDGEELAEGMKVTMQYVAYDAAGERLGSTWENDAPESFVLGDPSYDLLTEPLLGQPVGTRLLIANPTVDAQNEPSTVVNLVEITDAVQIPSRAEGEAVEPAEGLPTVTLGDDGAPSVEIPEGYEAPEELVAQTLIKGDGAEVTAEQTVTAHYTGWTLDGEVFDSSWERGEPSSFSLQQVIPGWTDGISGQTVGSQVLLVIPADQAYGAEADGSSELAGEDLIFVVDILDAD